MSLIKRLSALPSIKGVWDLGRYLLAISMAWGGIYLLSTLILHLFGITVNSALTPKVLCYLPFVPVAYLFGNLIFEVFLGLRAKLKGEWDFWMIMLSFSLAGMFIMPVRKLIFHLLGITVQTPLWIKVLIYIPIIPPTYYAGLLIFGTVLGQSNFFLGMIAKRLKFLTGRQNIKH